MIPFKINMKAILHSILERIDNLYKGCLLKYRFK